MNDSTPISRVKLAIEWFTNVVQMNVQLLFLLKFLLVRTRILENYRLFIAQFISITLK